MAHHRRFRYVAIFELVQEVSRVVAGMLPSDEVYHFVEVVGIFGRLPILPSSSLIGFQPFPPDLSFVTFFTSLNLVQNLN